MRPESATASTDAVARGARVAAATILNRNPGRTTMRRNQSGITLMSFLIVLVVVGFFLYVGMKVFPMYSEFYSVKSALKGMATEGLSGKDPAQIKDNFFRRMDISYSSNVKPEHVRVETSGGSTRIDVKYEVRVPMVANLDVVGRFEASQDLSRATALGE